MADQSEKKTDKPSISFGFSKKKETRKIKNATLNDEEHREFAGTDFITSVEGKQVKSVNPKEVVGELVIPLIEQNKWRKPKRPIDLDGEEEEEDGSSKKKQSKLTFSAEGRDQAESAAVQEILNEAEGEKEKWEERGKKDMNAVVPLLVKNKVPEGFETDDKLDVSLRAEEASPADYDAVPIEQYGMAMLRGMGWQQGMGIGKRKQVFKPIEAAARPKGLGLGADRSLVLQLDGKSKGKSFETAKNGQEELVVKSGSHCTVTSGKHCDSYGLIEGVDEDNARVVVKLSLSGQSITLSQYAIKLVTKKEYDKYSKYLNKSKVDKYKAKEDEKYKTHSSDLEHEHDRKDRRHHRHEDQHRDSDSDHKHDHSTSEKHREKDRHRDRHKHREEEDEMDRQKDRGNRKTKHEEPSHKSRDRDRRRKHDEQSLSYERSGSGKNTIYTSSNGHGPPHNLWLRRHLKVRVVDPEYKKGKYYKMKVIIEDVVSQDSCICRTEEGKVLEDVYQSMLETVIPRSVPSYVMIVNGKSRGQLGELLQKDKSTCQATVQLLSDRNKALTLDYDSICQYTGDINLEFDY